MKKILAVLIGLTIGLSLVAYFYPLPFLALTLAGIKQGHLWQFFTYPLLEPNIFALIFDMLLLWFLGASLIERIHTVPFLALYFGSALFAGLVALSIPHAIIAGPLPCRFAILTAWTMLNPYSTLLLFFVIPFKMQWLIAIFIGVTVFVDIAQNQWVHTVSALSSLIFSYLFILILWKQTGPFKILRPFEKSVLRFLEKRARKKEPYKPSKIYDFKSGRPVLDDEQFMDAMLDQISRLGEDSLTEDEKRRMREISQRRK